MSDKNDQTDMAKDAESETGESTSMQAPPLKPFSGKKKNKASKPGEPSFGQRVTRRIGDGSGIPRRGERRLAIDDAANSLNVGRNIRLSGEITRCEKLIVEGQVDAKLSDADTIEVLAGGSFKGSATVERADIDGDFEGDLVVKEFLTIIKNGRVGGSVRYGNIVIEAGGEISGAMETIQVAIDSDSVPNKK